MNVCINMCVCVCVILREREREREEMVTYGNIFFFDTVSLSRMRAETESSRMCGKLYKW